MPPKTLILGGMIMKRMIQLSAALTISATAVNAWVGQTENGIHFASTNPDVGTEISVICDAGFNAPITSISVVIDDQVPAPNSVVYMQFDNDHPLYVITDVEGAIASNTGREARIFNQVVAGLKSSANVKMRLFDGSEQVFDLAGSTEAIGDCKADFDKYQLASN